MDNPRSIFLRIPSSYDHVHLLGGAIKGVLKEKVEDEQELYLLELAVCEAVTNSIKHAYKSIPENFVCLEITISGHELVFKVKDQGQKLEENILQSRGVEGFQEYARVSEGGRGIPLIKGIMDQVYYHSDDQENCLSMVKRI